MKRERMTPLQFADHVALLGGAFTAACDAYVGPVLSIDELDNSTPLGQELREAWISMLDEYHCHFKPHHDKVEEVLAVILGLGDDAELLSDEPASTAGEMS